MKIMYVPSGYPNKLYPNANSFLKEQAEALANNGHQIILLNVAQKGVRRLKEKTERGIIKEVHGNIIEYRCWITTFKQEMFPCTYYIKCYSMLRKLYYYAIKEQGMPDVIYTHFAFYAGAAISKIASKDGIPITLMEHYSYLMKRHISHRIAYIEKKAFQNADVCCCVSDNLRKKMIEHLRLSQHDVQKMVVIENMINPIFQYCSLQKKDTFVFVSVGNLNKRKRFDLLINAFIHAFGPEDLVELQIGGNGEELSYLKEIVINAKRQHQIKFLGSINREQVYALDCYANCFVLFSRAETFGIVYREAMAVGRPIITSDHGGFDEELDSQDGIMVKDDTLENYALAMRKMFNEYSRYDLEKISYRCLSRFSQKVITNKIENALLQTIKTH